MKSNFVRVRIEPALKSEVHEILDDIGIKPSQAITMIYKLIQREHGFPCNLLLPNKETAQAIREARQKKGVIKAKDTKDLFRKLGI
ncbi:MAG: hypothetical protein A3F17_06480 [Gammaproteobacteria bacterium RIFCSPHIGHO2_12_FULL_41_15]|nr:MAG: hypothetical protein A3F17_06480 [Gammaproteobacteria bacterium RIFCSPHIGHO2_12_FULL_41_15]